MLNISLPELPLVFGEPIFGEDSIVNSGDISGNIVLFYRGKVSFATKAMRGQSAGANAVIILNTVDLWPFVMTDSIHEIEDGSMHIPVIMLSRQDSELLDTIQKKAKHHQSIAASLCIEPCESFLCR
jgi:hypothetical protein